MPTYIDRNKLLNSLDETYKKLNGLSPGFYAGFQNVVLRIKSFPTVRVEAAKHGRWEPCFEDWRKQIEGDKCSACGFEHYGCSIRNYFYCPNCGTKMDLGGADNG